MYVDKYESTLLSTKVHEYSTTGLFVDTVPPLFLCDTIKLDRLRRSRFVSLTLNNIHNLNLILHKKSGGTTMTAARSSLN